MLTLYASNRVERLAARLAEVVSEPRGPVLAPETVVVPGASLGRWLVGQIAARTGVCANLSVRLPAAFIWDCFRALLPALPVSSAFAPGPLAWRLFAELGEVCGEPGFEAVGRYLASGDELKRHRLAQRLAGVLDQYQVYRPDWVRAWERGEGEDWQAVLWRRLVAGGGGPHWVAAHDAFLEALAGGAGSGCLPPRVSLFALPALSPTYLDLVARIAASIEVHLFVLNPSREFWGDLESPAAVARRRARWRRRGLPDASAYYAVGNPLLASLGRMGRDYLARLAELEGWEEDLFEEPAAGGLLGAVQEDLLTLREPGAAPAREVRPGDESIQVHVCHGRLREVQVLYDRLLDLFARRPGLAPREVLVAAPDIDAYGPLVEAVFGAGDGEPALPWSLARGDPGASDPLLGAALGLLRLPASRLAASEVVGLLEVPAVMRRFGLDPEGIGRVRTWVRESGVRWGADAGARQALGLPAFEANSWAFGLRRLFLGYALPAEEEPYRGIVPYAHVEGTVARDLGGLQGLVDRLVAWQRRLTRPCPLAAWGERLGRLLRDFLDPDMEEAERLQDLRDAAADLAEEGASAGFSAPVGHELFAVRLAEALGTRGGGAPPPRGGITFGSLAALRGVPARVVCLLGMNGDEFPRVERPPSFDRVAREPARPGDRSRREDDRQLFLEAILAAREVLYLSYVGRSARDNAVLPPSVLVSELLDYLGRAFRWEGPGPERALVVDHPLQPFSPRYFDGADPRLFSFARQWVPGGGAGGVAAAAFADRPLEPPEEATNEVDLEALVRFFLNPARAYLARLGVPLVAGEEPLEDAEAFALEGLERYRVREEVLAAMLTAGPGPGPEAVVERLRGRGQIPVGPAGELALRRALAPVAALAEAVRAELAEPREPIDIEVNLGRDVLRGRLSPLVADGLLAWRLGKLRPRDRIGLWVRHLALNAAAPAAVGRASRLLAEDAEFALAPVGDARAHLARLVVLYRAGQLDPLPFYPAAAYAYARAVGRGAGRAEAQREAERAWEGRDQAPGDGADPHVALAMRGREPLGAAFAVLAVEVLGPMIEAAGGGAGWPDARA